MKPWVLATLVLVGCATVKVAQKSPPLPPTFKLVAKRSLAAVVPSSPNQHVVISWDYTNDSEIIFVIRSNNIIKAPWSTWKIVWTGTNHSTTQWANGSQGFYTITASNKLIANWENFPF